MSGPISPLNVRSKTAKKLVSERITGALHDLMGLLEEDSTDAFTLHDKTVTIQSEKPTKGGRGRRPPSKMGGQPFEKRFKEVKEGLDEIMAELDASVKESLEDNRDEKRVQVILSIILFLAGVAVFTIGVLQGRLEIATTAAVPGLFILYPYNNLTKIGRENTSLYLLVPWIKINIVPCGLREDPKDVEKCYTNGVKKFNGWMVELRKKAYGS